MAVYYNRLNQRRHEYRNIDTSSNTVVPNAAQPNPKPSLRSGLTVNLTAGTSATPAEQGRYTAGG